MKRIALMLAVLVLILAGCQGRTGSSAEAVREITKETAVVENELNDGILIAYLPAEQSSLDYIEEAAHMIQEVTGGTVININRENNSSEDCGTVFLGVTSSQPQLPENLRQFLENHDLGGKTIIPFFIANRGDQEAIAEALYEMEPDAEFLDGFLLSQDSTADLEKELDEWLSGLGYNKQ
ncbi:flavodoxin family protein [Enterocloster bolteae]|uniref:flavodoxin family protein n=1 Tax=Enterocloster bolteae TaxID=208479 RepID=UPI0028DC4E94|nr:lipoprotein [Enterocloster bolteae]